MLFHDFRNGGCLDCVSVSDFQIQSGVINGDADVIQADGYKDCPVFCSGIFGIAVKRNGNGGIACGKRNDYAVFNRSNCGIA